PVRREVALGRRVLGEVAAGVLERADALAGAEPRQVALADRVGLAVREAGHHRGAGDVDPAEHVLAIAEDVGDDRAAVVVLYLDGAPLLRVRYALDHHHADAAGHRPVG